MKTLKKNIHVTIIRILSSIEDGNGEGEVHFLDLAQEQKWAAESKEQTLDRVHTAVEHILSEGWAIKDGPWIEITDKGRSRNRLWRDKREAKQSALGAPS